MIKRLFLFASLLLTISCEKETPEADTLLNLSATEAVLQNTEGSSVTVTLTAKEAWTLTMDGAGYEVMPQSGQSGTTTVTVTATAPNTNDSRQTLGHITFRLTSGSAECTLTIRQRAGQTPQTMLLYMPGTNLLWFYEQNIAGIEAAINAQVPGDGRILVCYQPTSHSTAVMMELHFDDKRQTCVTTQLKSYSSFAADDPTSVQQMLADAQLLAPARKYGLVIGCHGKAWIPASSGNIENKSLRPHPGEGLWTPRPDALPTRSFGDSGRELDIPELAAALTSLPNRFSYLIFDACFMANIETLYDLREAVDVVIASPCEIMAAGFPYSRAIPYLFTDNGASHNLEQVCKEFYTFYNDDWNTVPSNARSGCISLAITAELDDLAEVMRRINAQPKQPYTEELQSYEGLPTHVFYDLGHYVTLSCGDMAQLDDFHKQLDKTFPKTSRLHTPSFYSVYGRYSDPKTHPIIYYSGVSVSEPSTRYIPENQQTSWYRATH